MYAIVLKFYQQIKGLCEEKIIQSHCQCSKEAQPIDPISNRFPSECSFQLKSLCSVDRFSKVKQTKLFSNKWRKFRDMPGRREKTQNNISERIKEQSYLSFQRLFLGR